MPSLARYGLASACVAGLFAYTGVGLWALGYPVAGLSLLGVAAAIVLGLAAVAEVVNP